MTRSCVSLVLACLALLPIASGCRSAPLANPTPIAALEDTGRTRDALLRALPERGWMVMDDEPGEMLVELNVLGKHTAVVKVAYDRETLALHYVSSDNLNYQKDSSGREVIHPNYNIWVNDLLVDISSQLAAERAKAQ